MFIFIIFNRGTALKKKYIGVVVCCLIVSLFASCGTAPVIIGYDAAGKLNMNEEYATVRGYLSREPVVERVIEIKGKSDQFRVLLYRRWIRTTDSWVSLFSPDKYDLFAFTFKNNKLYFWGNVDDFKRSDDATANDLGDAISELWRNQ